MKLEKRVDLGPISTPATPRPAPAGCPVGAEVQILAEGRCQDSRNKTGCCAGAASAQAPGPSLQTVVLRLHPSCSLGTCAFPALPAGLSVHEGLGL